MLKVIVQQTVTVSSETIELIASGLYGFGNLQFISPSSLWVDNKTYIFGNESNASNNTIKMMQYNHITKGFLAENVGTGTDVPDTFQHARTSGWIDVDGYIYGAQSNPHNSIMDLWKSDNPHDITAFTELSNITGSNAYAQGFLAIDNKFTYCVRTGGTGAPNYNLSVNRSSTDLPTGTFTQTEITVNSDTNMRYYNRVPLIYGNPTKHYIVSNMRNDTTEDYYASCLFVTDDFETYSNYDETYSKDVVTVSAITSAEAVNFELNGVHSDQSQDYRFMNCIQVDDVFYGTQIKAGTTDYYVFKVSNGVLSSVLLDIPNIMTNIEMQAFLFYNGNNLIVTANTDQGGGVTNKEIWTCPMDLSEFTQKLVFEDVGYFGEAIKFPENMDEINGEYGFVVDITGGATFTFHKTTDRFIH